MTTKTIEERLKEFFTDPKHSEESAFFKASVKTVISEIAEEERKKKEEEDKIKPKGFFGFLFGEEHEDKK